MSKSSLLVRHWLIRSRWRHWLLPLLCLLPYSGSIVWLLARGQLWIAQLMLAPLAMAAVLAGVTLELARREFGVRRQR
jgi:hypothetical protein